MKYVIYKPTKAYTSIDGLLTENPKSISGLSLTSLYHDKQASLYNIRLPNFPESMGNSNVMTDKGFLIVFIQSDIFHIYDLFGSSTKKFSEIKWYQKIPMLKNFDPCYIGCHRLMLYKNTNTNYYYAKPEIVPYGNGKGFLTSFDTDGFYYDGKFYDTTELDNYDLHYLFDTTNFDASKDLYFRFHKKQYFAIKGIDANVTVEFYESKESDDKITLTKINKKLVDTSFTYKDNGNTVKVYVLDTLNSNSVVDNIGESDISDDYLVCRFKGTASSSDQMLVEVF